jgi:hypothetical protein
MTPLLSVRRLTDFTASDFKAYVRGLFARHVVKSRQKKGIRLVKPFTFSVNKKGTLVLRVNRRPKWLSSDEIDGIAEATGLASNVVWLRVLRKASGIIVSTAEEQERIRAELESVPW